MPEQVQKVWDPNGQSSGWYTEALESVNPETREILEKYSGIAPDEVIPHCKRVRDEAWAVFNYPCIGQWRFLDLSIGQHPAYPEILSRMKTGEQKLLDLGCCFAQDLRRLAYDGVATENCYGTDLRLDFMELGYKLFLDKAKFYATHIEADVLAEGTELDKLDGQIDIIQAASFFHLFDLETQKVIARRVVKLLRPVKGSLIVGRQVGNVEAGEIANRVTTSKMMFRHNDESWKAMWKEIGDETGTQWDVQAKLLEWDSTHTTWSDKSVRRLQFSVRRL